MRFRSALLPFVLTLPIAAQSPVEGRWIDEHVVSGQVELESYWLEIRPTEAGLELEVFAPRGHYVVPGAFDGATNVATFTASDERGSLEVVLELNGDHLVGSARTDSRVLPLDLSRTTQDAPRREPPRIVDFARERPEWIEPGGLDDELAERITLAILEEMDEQRVVGLSAAFVVGGEIVDQRSFGWQDYHADVPATGDTMYRWASISKPLTAVAALQLAETGTLDLDRDIRTYVPEWPDKGQVITARQLLGHTAGVVHYANMLPRTLKEYDVPHPWADSILRLDMFNESDLLFEPGAQFSYTTPGYVLLGAVVERAGEGTFVEQVTKRVCEPLGMTTMQPDYPWVDIANRAAGYEQFDEGTLCSGDDNIAWKLPAGGWISTVGDLARFGIGLMSGPLLSDDSRAAMWQPQTLADGTRTTYGLGVGIGSAGEMVTVSHSGGQKKTSTYLMCCPEAGMAVALMCNTEGTGLSRLARYVLGQLLDAGD